jgi:hypothetical protein
VDEGNSKLRDGNYALEKAVGPDGESWGFVCPSAKGRMPSYPITFETKEQAKNVLARNILHYYEILEDIKIE